jgi:hypothetical protein
MNTLPLGTNEYDKLINQLVQRKKKLPFSSFFLFSPLAFPRLLLDAMSAPNGEQVQHKDAHLDHAIKRNTFSRIHECNWRQAA